MAGEGADTRNSPEQFRFDIAPLALPPTPSIPSGSVVNVGDTLTLSPPHPSARMEFRIGSTGNFIPYTGAIPLSTANQGQESVSGRAEETITIYVNMHIDGYRRQVLTLHYTVRGQVSQPRLDVNASRFVNRYYENNIPRYALAILNERNDSRSHQYRVNVYQTEVQLRNQGVPIVLGVHPRPGMVTEGVTILYTTNGVEPSSIDSPDWHRISPGGHIYIHRTGYTTIIAQAISPNAPNMLPSESVRIQLYVERHNPTANVDTMAGYGGEARSDGIIEDFQLWSVEYDANVRVYAPASELEQRLQDVNIRVVPVLRGEYSFYMNESITLEEGHQIIYLYHIVAERDGILVDLSDLRCPPPTPCLCGDVNLKISFPLVPYRIIGIWQDGVRHSPSNYSRVSINDPIQIHVQGLSYFALTRFVGASPPPVNIPVVYVPVDDHDEYNGEFEDNTEFELNTGWIIFTVIGVGVLAILAKYLIIPVAKSRRRP